MEIESIDVITAEGITEEHKTAIGYEVGPAGELIILYGVSELDSKGDYVRVPYPGVTYAPGWQKVIVQGAKPSTIQAAHIFRKGKFPFN